MLTAAIRRAFLPGPVRIAAAIAASLAAFGIIWLGAIKSEAYEFADWFVATDQRIAELTGAQNDRSLRWIDGFSMSYGDSNGHASLTLQVVCENGDFRVPLKLEKYDGRWKVVNMMVLNERGDVLLSMQ